MTQACETLENNLRIRQLHSHWYCNLDVFDPKVQELMDSGYAVFPKERDELGRQILIVTPSSLDPDRIKAADVVRYLSIVFEHFQADEITQVAGLIFVIDASNLSMKILSLFSLMELKTVFTTIQDVVPVRLKEYHIINLPSFASSIAEILSKVLSSKMQKRIFFSKSLEDFQKRINTKILPKEYGGHIPKADMINEFKEEIRDYREFFLNLDNRIQTTFNKNSKTKYNPSSDLSDTSFLGSFKKLELD